MLLLTSLQFLQTFWRCAYCPFIRSWTLLLKMSAICTNWYDWNLCLLRRQALHSFTIRYRCRIPCLLLLHFFLVLFNLPQSYAVGTFIVWAGFVAKFHIRQTAAWTWRWLLFNNLFFLFWLQTTHVWHFCTHLNKRHFLFLTCWLSLKPFMLHKNQSKRLILRNQTLKCSLNVNNIVLNEVVLFYHLLQTMSQF